MYLYKKFAGSRAATTNFMKQFLTIADANQYVKQLRQDGCTIGFVPTMGALHEGHLTLIRRSKRENDYTACSIFVNPIQFNNKEDLEKYPRNLAADLTMLEKAGCDFVFTPSVAEMYPGTAPERIDLSLDTLDKVMEGAFRPGHFNGVAIVVKKLFEIIQPSRAYFGKKDYQQLAVIRFMTEALNLPVEIVACDTVREPDGLAMSSRNKRLTTAERRIAPRIYEVLREVKVTAGDTTVEELKEWAIAKIEEIPALRVEYFEIAEKESLMPIGNWKLLDRSVAFVAVFLGDVRLIDNIELFS